MTSLSTWVPTASVYRCFDAEGRLLYIGASSSVKQRLRGHRQKSPWWSEVAEVAVDPPLPYDDAREAEKDAIVAEQPRHNKKRDFVKWPKVTHVEDAG
jgi:hypothetical protein